MDEEDPERGFGFLPLFGVRTTSEVLGATSLSALWLELAAAGAEWDDDDAAEVEKGVSLLVCSTLA